MTIFDDIADWGIWEDVGDWPKTSWGTTILRLAAIAAPLTWATTVVGQLPALFQTAAAGLTTISPGLLRGETFWKAVVSEGTFTAIRAATALAANPAVMASLGVKLPAAISSALAAIQKGASTAQTTATMSSHATQSYLQSEAANFVNEKIAKPIARMIEPTSPEASRVEQAKSIVGRVGNMDAALAEVGAIPEQIEQSGSARADAAGVALNHLVGHRVYDADMFDAATGRVITDPETLGRLLTNASLRGANRDFIAALQRRFDAAVLATPSYNPHPGGTVEERSAAQLREDLARVDPNADPLTHRHLTRSLAFAERVEAMSIDELERALNDVRARLASGTCTNCQPQDVPYLTWNLRAKRAQIRDASSVAAAADQFRVEEQIAASTREPRGRRRSIFGDLLLASVLTAPAWLPIIALRWRRRRGTRGRAGSSSRGARSRR